MDLLLAFADLGDVVGSLHPHKCVHLHSKGLFNAERHVPGKVGLAVKQARQRRPGHLSAAAAAVTDRPAGSIISVRMKSPGWGGFLMGMVVPLSL